VSAVASLVFFVFHSFSPSNSVATSVYPSAVDAHIESITRGFAPKKASNASKTRRSILTSLTVRWCGLNAYTPSYLLRCGKLTQAVFCHRGENSSAYYDDKLGSVYKHVQFLAHSHSNHYGGKRAKQAQKCC